MALAALGGFSFGDAHAADKPKAPRQLTAREKADALAAGLDPRKLAAIRAELDGFVASGEITGAVALMGRRGRIGALQVVGLADARSKTPMRPSTLFRLEGMTKVATATAVLMLRDEGKLDLEDPVAKHLPAFCDQQVRAAGAVYVDPPRAVTVADLLRETSGLDCAPATKIPTMPATLAAAVDEYGQRSLVRAPGQTVASCDGNYLALGRIIEVLSGESFEKFLRRRLFEPLRMTGATFKPNAAQRRRMARAYEDVDPGPATKLMPVAPVRGDAFANPARGLIATATDHARLLQMLLDGGMARGRRFLRPESAANMLTIDSALPVAGGGGVVAGLGVDVVRSASAVNTPLAPGSFGNSGRLGTHGWVDPTSDAVYVVLTQRREPDGMGGQAVRLAFQNLGADAIVRRSTEPKPGLFSARRPQRPR
jgi:CubicO group peptidase (beta-lactamase class C family)